jgi:hypothetical protein
MTDSARRGLRGTQSLPRRPGLFLAPFVLALFALTDSAATDLLARQEPMAPVPSGANPTFPLPPGSNFLNPPAPLVEQPQVDEPGGARPSRPKGTAAGRGGAGGPGGGGGRPGSGVGGGSGRQRVEPFSFTVEPGTPVKELLPTPPKVEKVRPVTGDDLTKVPEVQFQAPLAKDTDTLQQTAIQLAKINHVNRSETDGFLKALVAERQDLAGLPFAMGDACRTKGERNRQFAVAVNTVRHALGQQPATPPQGGQFSGGFGGNLGISGGPGAFPGGITGNPGGPGGLGGLQGGITGFPGPGASSGGLSGNSRGVLSSTAQSSGGPSGPAVQSVTAQQLQQMGVFVQTGTIPEGQPTSSAADFWTQFRLLCEQQDAAQPRLDKEVCEHIAIARIAALMQILAPESPSFRMGLVKYLAGVAHPEATRALARMALFSAEDEVRLAAVAALQVRRERDYTDVLVRGLRYPWPKVAGNAADAIVRLKREDLLPQLVALLEDTDPRAPLVQEVGTKKVTVVNEMVRINHHRNCALCHSPGTNGDVSNETLTAGVPLPNESLSGPSGGYRRSRSETLVRIDVTYLRQDFSMFQAVTDANPWPEMQRFDFLVRTRQLSAEEAVAYREQFGSNDPTRPSAYQKAALAALREMTGRDTAPTAEAWRKLLDLPARPQPKGTADISALGPVSQLR